ncbi:MAG TPA: right-handed parallel beta-helix repeat-containing protein [Rhodanobacteraceae bacterium]|nr:right-handed parallel beta-helix repeat-containing protein [Rhodanobacteraceae bacterium]
MRFSTLVSIVALGLLWQVDAHAFLCAKDVASLKSHLASNSPTPYTIRVQEGVYAVGSFALVTDAPVAIVGGYLDTDCLNRDPNPAPAKTVIDAQGQAAGLYQNEYSQGAGITLDGLTLANGKTLTIETGNQYNGYSGNITLRRTRITNWIGDANALGSPPPVTFDAQLGNLVLENVLIDHLSGPSNAGCAVDIHMAGDSYAGLRFVTAALNGPDKLCLSNWVPTGDRIVDIDDSLIWAVSGNGASPISQHFDNYSGAGGTMKVNIVNSGYTTFDNYFGFATVTDIGQIFNYPNFVNPAIADYHLATGSSAIDAGATQFPNGSVPPTDIEGNPRPTGAAPDPGAYEYQKPPPSLSDVINVNDSGPGSLRDAIHYANQQPGPTTITFHVPGYCPYIIPLKSALETITKSTIIDGTTNPGYVPNSSAVGFNANNCVVIRPASGTLVAAFAVPVAAAPGTSLTVKGISFSGFAEPIVLAGGRNHLIVGNQFGGTIGGLQLSGSTFQAISVGSSVGSNVQIGGDDVSARNLIANAGQTGINIGTSVAGCQIVNNVIGLDIDGITARGAQSGLHLSGGGCAIRDNIIGGNSGDGIWLQGDGNTLKRNVIGIAANNNPVPNGGWGIRVDGSGNVIGLAKNYLYDGQFNANYVQYNVLGGIGVTSTSTGNAIRGNASRDNGPNYGDALDIDLNVDGATANLVPNPGTGANALENHPLITGLAFAGKPQTGQAAVPTTVSGIFYGNPGTYQIDLYFAQYGCVPGKRGHAENYLATSYLVVPAGTTSSTFMIAATLPIYFNPGSVTAGITDAAGNSSELGVCAPVDTILRGTFDLD